MINVIDFFNAPRFDKELDDMFLARKLAFTDRLGCVPSMNDREVDQFDTYRSQPTYLTVTDKGIYQGSLRLVPMSKPNMLANVFPYLVPEEKLPYGYGVKEISRIHMVQRPDTPRKRGINVYLGELFAGLGQYALRINCREMISVVDARMLRVIRIAGAKPELLDPNGYLQDDGIMCYVISLSRADLDRVKESFGIDKIILND
jgi:N-acyl-L-homoserine lactone synthetase